MHVVIELCDRVLEVTECETRDKAIEHAMRLVAESSDHDPGEAKQHLEKMDRFEDGNWSVHVAEAT